MLTSKNALELILQVLHHGFGKIEVIYIFQIHLQQGQVKHRRAYEVGTLQLLLLADVKALILQYGLSEPLKTLLNLKRIQR